VIGVNASISNNVTVAERCFIGANALISKNTEPNGLFKMWYILATEWVQEEQDSKPKHYYTHWQRDDKLALEVSDDGWDSEMICYAHPLNYKGSVYALYNGNGYGATGVGLAVRV